MHVNHGLMRKGESEQVIDVFKNQMDANLVYVDATDRFLGKLVDIAEPEAKRKIIGAEFIRVFEEEARKVGNEVSFLAQGTIYPDILESKDGVKAHHNVGGLPDDLQFELCEPVKLLYKDEVRVVGRELGLPENMVERQPSPALAWAFAASALLPATVSRRCARQMRSFARRSTRQGLPSGSTLLSCPTSAPPACATASALTTGRASSAASTPSTS
ncbi:hypothetical protein [Ellagibacter isourolithinifaciens]|uniref:hypothetical protein n=1 Tax=Ellagibacter isourolithinifaciens TaxID=2137581 RepID=UPI003AF0C4CD